MKPIIFSTPMVQAILDGRKTQTRRVIKIDDAPENWKKSIAGTSIVRTSPYDAKLSRYAPGDILWVRETWTPFCVNKTSCRNAILAHPDYCYKATVDKDCVDKLGCKWRPSIHMPRDAARIFLRVTSVRAERLQEITVEGVMAEGLPADNEIRNPDPATHESIKNWNLQYARYLFHNLWDSTVKKQDIDKYGWDANPWVWVIEFERCDKEEI